MKSFRSIMAGTLVLEAIVVGLSLLVVSKRGGLPAASEWLTVGVIFALLATCGLLRFRFAIPLVLLWQLVMIGCVFLVTPLGVVGILFAIVWALLLWMRYDVARKQAAGKLPSQQ
ncbi:MAG: DUF4233 domain-containing protein [Sciscionella sp.]|nr:DUF4233 domain-containing protein [Sciscionella sp.]